MNPALNPALRRALGFAKHRTITVPSTVVVAKWPDAVLYRIMTPARTEWEHEVRELWALRDTKHVEDGGVAHFIYARSTVPSDLRLSDRALARHTTAMLITVSTLPTHGQQNLRMAQCQPPFFALFESPRGFEEHDRERLLWVLYDLLDVNFDELHHGTHEDYPQCPINLKSHITKLRLPIVFPKATYDAWKNSGVLEEYHRLDNVYNERWMDAEMVLRAKLYGPGSTEWEAAEEYQNAEFTESNIEADAIALPEVRIDAARELLWGAQMVVQGLIPEAELEITTPWAGEKHTWDLNHVLGSITLFDPRWIQGKVIEIGFDDDVPTWEWESKKTEWADPIEVLFNAGIAVPESRLDEWLTERVLPGVEQTDTELYRLLGDNPWLWPPAELAEWLHEQDLL